jgi:DNA-binding NarL/FixJ family response regulator
MRKTVLLVDDHDLIRQGLARAFERSMEFEVVGQAATVHEGQRLVSELSPDVVVTDVRLPDGTGLDLVRKLRQHNADIGIVVLTMYAGDDRLFEAMKAGASAFVAKDAPADDVVSAARHSLVSPRTFTAATLVEAMQRRMSPSSPRLTQREMAVLGLLADGLSVSAIAKNLFVSESTVKTHIARIYEKLGAANRAQAIMGAVRSGLLSDS